MSSIDSSTRSSNPPSTDAVRPVSLEQTASKPSSSLRWLESCAQLFIPQEKDSKDVRCMIEVFQDRVIRSDVVLVELEKIMIQSVHDFVSKQAEYCESLFAGEANIVRAIREADSVNSIVSTQLDSSQIMSRNLLQRITGIIEAAPAPRPTIPPVNPPK